jgi:alpha-1,3-rhamnosyl/mannosyltransferase
VLVRPGAPTPYEEELRALAGDLGVAARVRYPGWLSEPDLEGFYALSSAVVIASKHEGFGLPVLEAMARGAPVLCSRGTSLDEVAGDAAIRASADDPGQLAVCADRLLRDGDLRERLVAAGRERAGRFTWERVGELSMQAYREAVARLPRRRRSPGRR